jgi:hypothetical protein
MPTNWISSKNMAVTDTKPGIDAAADGTTYR